jgi:hypothetical protein
METYSYVDDQDNSSEIESVSARLTFLTLEWSLIIGWILSLLLIWRVTFIAVIEYYLPVRSMRLSIIVAALSLMIACVYALTMTGRWLRQRPATISLMRRWLINLLYLGSFTALGRIIVWYFVDGRVSL